MKKNVIIVILALAVIAGGLFSVFIYQNATSFEATYQPFENEDILYEDGELYVDSQLLLTAADSTSKRKVEKLVESYGGEIVGYLSISNDYQISFPNGKSLDELHTIMEEISQTEEIETVSLHSLTPISTESVNYTSDPWINADRTDDTSGSKWNEATPSGNNWWAEAIMLPAVWRMENIDFQDVKVGIYDTMFDLTHEDLDNGRFAKNWYNPQDEDGNCTVSSLYQTNQNPDINPAHGTHVAGILAGEGGNGTCISGTSQNAQLYGYSYDGNSPDKFTERASIYETKYAISLMLNEGVKIINMSCAYGELLVAAQNNNSIAQTELINRSSSFEQFLLKCLEHYDFLIVKSAGNDSGHLWSPCEVDKDHPYGYIEDKKISADITYDAIYDFLGAIENETVRNHIIMVGAVTNSTEENFYESPNKIFTTEDNVGTTFYYTCYTNRGDRVDVYAPGNDILSDFPGNISALDTGTSMAAPMVSGIAALVWGYNPNLKAEQVKEIIIDSATEDMKVVNAFYAVLQTMMLTRSEDASEDPENSSSGIVLGYTFENVIDQNSEDSSNPVADVTIRISEKDNTGNVQEIKSDQLGSYQEMLPPGTYIAEIKENGYHVMSQEFSITSGRITSVNFLMEQSITSFQVIDKNSKNPVAGVQCQITSSDGNGNTILQNTDEEGNAFIHLLPGTYHITFRAEGYDAVTQDIQVNTYDDTELGIIEIEKTIDKAYNRYRQLINQYEDTYGRAGIDNKRLSSDYFTSWMTGLCYLELIDFDNNGMEELLLVYKKTKQKSSEVDFVGYDFIFEVWEYKEDNIHLLDSGELYGCDGGGETLIITKRNDNTYVLTGGADSFAYNYYHGYKDNRTFGIVREALMDENGSADNGYHTYKINGNAVSEEEWEKTEKEWSGNERTYPMNSSASAENNPYNNALQKIKSTKEKLGMDISYMSSKEYISQNTIIQQIKASVKNNDDYSKVVVSVTKGSMNWKKTFIQDNIHYSQIYGVAECFDITGDGEDELILELEAVGSTYCAADVIVYTFSNNKMEQILYLDDEKLSSYKNGYMACCGVSRIEKGKLYISSEETTVCFTYKNGKWTCN